MYSYNKTKTLHWLQQKAKFIAKSLSNQNIDLSDGSKAASLKLNDDLKTEGKFNLFENLALSLIYYPLQLICTIYNL